MCLLAEEEVARDYVVMSFELGVQPQAGSLWQRLRTALFLLGFRPTVAESDRAVEDHVVGL